MKMRKTVQAKKPQKDVWSSGLVGRCFVIYGDDGKVGYQGVVRAKITEDKYLVQFFEWIMGEPSTCEVVRLDDMTATKRVRGTPGMWEFFEDDGHLKFWCENGPGQHLMH
ncbi:MAG: hypothetical protein L0210_10855 [Rhodospirillales bacterium]|nr:hypothetical protein [Rhodospirillales bacterium]